MTISIFKIDSFLIAPWHQGKEGATILIAPTVESYLATIQKHQELASSAYPQQLMLYTHPWPCRFFYFCCFGVLFDVFDDAIVLGVLFDVFDDVIFRFLMQWPQYYGYRKSSLIHDFWWKLDVSWRSDEPSGLSYICEESKYPWKLDRSCHFRSNGSLYIFNLILWAPFFCFVFTFV